MRKFIYVGIISCLLQIVANSDQASRAFAEERDEEQLSYIMLTEGIVGGFVPAHVRQRTMIVVRDDKVELLVLKQPQRNDKPTYLRGELMAEQWKTLLAALKKEGLYELPVESPPGCQDIYKMDTSVAVRVGDTFWRNGGPAGCVHGQSKIQPTKAQQETFRSVVELLKKLADKNAKDELAAKDFDAVLQQLQRDGQKEGKPSAAKKPAAF